MFTLLGAFFKRNMLVIAGWAAAALAVAAVLLGARQAGRNAERVDRLKKEKDYADEIIRQNRIVNRGTTDSMRTKLSGALKRKRNP